MKTYFATKFQFNLESMSDKVDGLRARLIDSNQWEVPNETILGYPFSVEGLDELEQECDKWLDIVTTRKVTGKEYGRIKEIADWRNEIRYRTCIQRGMSEKDAAVAFDF